MAPDNGFNLKHLFTEISGLACQMEFTYGVLIKCPLTVSVAVNVAEDWYFSIYVFDVHWIYF